MTKKPLKYYLYIAMGLLMLALFGYRSFVVLQEPGIGLMELYCLGGLLLGAGLIREGIRGPQG